MRLVQMLVLVTSIKEIEHKPLVLKAYWSKTSTKPQLSHPANQSAM